MKNLLVLFCSLILIACKSDDGDPVIDSNELIGKWKLIEEYTDPGDGSGDFTPVTSNRTFDFFNDGTVITNGDMCVKSESTGSNKSGTWSETGTNETFYDGEIIPEGCAISETKLFYGIQGGNLIIWYQCIESCAQKFEKIN